MRIKWIRAGKLLRTGLKVACLSSKLSVFLWAEMRAPKAGSVGRMRGSPHPDSVRNGFPVLRCGPLKILTSNQAQSIVSGLELKAGLGEFSRQSKQHVGIRGRGEGEKA